MKNFDIFKNFVFNGLLLDDTLDDLEKQGISVRSGEKVKPPLIIDERDFSPIVIYSAQKMASVYIALFCLENAYRELIEDRLSERKGPKWWEKCVSSTIRKGAESLKRKEEKIKYHVAQRASSLIGYVMFGDLTKIIIKNWDLFSDLFPDQHWLSARFNDLEISRNIIMHSGVLPDIEIERIESIVRDWIRQVG